MVVAVVSVASALVCFPALRHEHASDLESIASHLLAF